MSSDPKAHLVYGFALGGDEDGEGYLFTMNDGSDPSTFGRHAAGELLLHRIGGLAPADSYTDMARWRADRAAADDRVDVEFITHGAEHACTALVAHQVTVEWGEHAEIQFGQLAQERRAGDWDTKLYAATRAIGITPNQPAPRWLLLASYS